MDFIFGISLLTFSWKTTSNPCPEKRDEFIKQKSLSAHGMLGGSYIADKSRHPVSLVPVLGKI